MKIAILSRNPDLYSTSRLREEAEKKRARVPRHRYAEMLD